MKHLSACGVDMDNHKYKFGKNCQIEYMFNHIDLIEKEKNCQIVILGDPIPQHRPRACIRGKRAGVYSDQAVEKTSYQVKLISEFNREIFKGPLWASFYFFIVRPKSHYGTGKNADRLKKSAPVHPAKKPDISNLQKWVEDCANGILWVDDSQIIQTHAIKIYTSPGEGAMTIIRISEV